MFWKKKQSFASPVIGTGKTLESKYSEETLKQVLLWYR